MLTKCSFFSCFDVLQDRLEHAEPVAELGYPVFLFGVLDFPYLSSFDDDSVKQKGGDENVQDKNGCWIANYCI